MRGWILLLWLLVLPVGCGEAVTEEMVPDVGGSPDADGAGCPAQIGAIEGPEPEFPGGDLLLGIDVIYPEYQRGAKVIMLDARPPFDFNLDHIEGAVNVPYYDAEKCTGTLPKDTWIVTYCACPHQESIHAANVLLEAGFTKVHTLDEGYIVWKQRGYPVSSD